jgi:ferrous iron transport protein B
VLAAVTNAFVPCNGRFPAIIAIASVFFVGGRGFPYSLLSAVTVFLLIFLGIAVSFLVTRLLSATLLSGVPSSFILEIPPFRRPRITAVILRSIKERTLTVLARAVAVAAPAGAILWLISNIKTDSGTWFSHLADGLSPIGEALSLDGVILLGFLLGIVANEIVIPVVLMGYTGSGGLMGETDTASLGKILTDNGWTVFTAVAFLLFALFHIPCITTLLTVRKETGKTRYALLAAAVPTLVGILLCSLLTLVRVLFF